MGMDPSELIDKMFEDAQCAVTRKAIQARTCGVMRTKTLANMDSEGTGIPGAFKIGVKVLYPTDNVISWLKQRLILE